MLWWWRVRQRSWGSGMRFFFFFELYRHAFILTDWNVAKNVRRNMLDVYFFFLRRRPYSSSSMTRYWEIKFRLRLFSFSSLTLSLMDWKEKAIPTCEHTRWVMPPFESVIEGEQQFDITHTDALCKSVPDDRREVKHTESNPRWTWL